MCNTSDLSPNRSFNPTLHGPTAKPIRTRVLISQCRANPCLDITHMPKELLTLSPFTSLELLDGFAYPVQTITNYFQTVFDGGQFTWFQPFEPLQLVEVVLGGLGLFEAYCQRGVG
ncbi:hypothetical protein HanIR_Chr07g0340281 [Helianthus annuus]|nr:hypothetical protein HanIR_Chr07g0340281 [Helianthus annuus]KAJ0564669.1 hypothetical protein HanHA89_Chr07g0276871 [Helianthus annuus]